MAEEVAGPGGELSVIVSDDEVENLVTALQFERWKTSDPESYKTAEQLIDKGLELHPIFDELLQDMESSEQRFVESLTKR